MAVCLLVLILVFVSFFSMSARGGKVVGEKYLSLTKRLREISALEGISGLLGWDEMVMLPPGSSASRGAQKEVLAGITYDKRADPELGSLLESLSGGEDLSDVQKANVRIALADHQRLVRVPKDLVQLQAKLETEGYNAWIDARKSADFSKFSPVLNQWIDAKKQEAECIAPGEHTYDTLLYAYEKGMTASRLDEIFTEVKAGLVPLIADIKKHGTVPNRGILDGKYDTDVQAELCKSIALDLGFNMENGRLDVSVHPFSKFPCSCSPLPMSTPLCSLPGCFFVYIFSSMDMCRVLWI